MRVEISCKIGDNDNVNLQMINWLILKYVFMQNIYMQNKKKKNYYLEGNCFFCVCQLWDFVFCMRFLCLK